MIRDQQCGLLNKKIQERTRAAIAMSILLPTNTDLYDFPQHLLAEYQFDFERIDFNL